MFHVFIDLDEPKEDHSLSVSSNALMENLQPIPALNRQSTENVEKGSNPRCDYRSWVGDCSDESDTDVEEPQQPENLNDFPNRENTQDGGNIAK